MVKAWLLFSIAVTLSRCDGSQGERVNMTRSPLLELHTCADLVGFWQFSALDAHHFGVLERDADRTHSTLSIGRIVGGESRIIKRIVNEDVSIRAIDVTTIGGDLVFALEVNRGRAAQIERADLAAFADPSLSGNPFQLVREIGLSEQQAARVRVPPAEKWNVADRPKPEGWLFSPRVVRGSGQQIEVIANTADGQAVSLGAAPISRDPIPDAAEPQECRLDRHRYVAFKRYGEPYHPFWTLARYSGDGEVKTGNLTVIVDGTPSRDLSAELQIGPVTGFALTADGDGRAWIFALRPASAVTRVAALTHEDQGWMKVDDWEVEGQAQRVSAERRADGWHLVFAMKTLAGSSLMHQLWRSGR